MFELVIFSTLGLLIVASGILIIICKKPIYNAFFLVVSLISMAGIYGLLNAPFLAVLQILIYAGAGIVIIVMIVMFFKIESYSSLPFKKWWFGLILLCILFVDIMTIRMDLPLSKNSVETLSTREISEVLFSDYIYQFELISILIIVGVIGVFILAKQRKDE